MTKNTYQKQSHIYLLIVLYGFGPRDQTQSLRLAAQSNLLSEMIFLDASASRYRDVCHFEAVIKSAAGAASLDLQGSHCLITA